MRSNLLRSLLVIAAAIVWHFYSGPDGEATGPDVAVFADASDWHSGDQVRGGGEIVRVLADDNEGSRHQRMIIRVSGDRTLLIAHNIDLAPRVPGIRAGDWIEFYGEYEDNDRGGVIHWTHHDPRGRHEDGWLEFEGQRYQ